MTFRDHAAQVIARCRQLAELSETRGETTRTFLSAPMRDVHSRVAGWMSVAGMTVRVDPAGNIRGVYPAAADASSAPRLFFGSHLDTVPNAGAFDGILGVMIGIEIVQMAMQNEQRYPFAIEVIGFSDEEGVRFGVPFIGSRAFAGLLDASLLEHRDSRGRTIEQAIREYGLDPARLSEAACSSTAVGYVEFHIEQGPVLETLNLPLAVVDAIVGQTRGEMSFAGMANHAGTTPMSARHDALACAAEWVIAVEREAGATPELVATVGQLSVEPGASNVIPGRCTASLDVRHRDDVARKSAVEHLTRAARDIGSRRGVEAQWESTMDQASVVMSQPLADALFASVEEAGFSPHRMSSGAGHDAMVVASRMPAAMMFIRSEKGVSHHPAESVKPSDVASALEAGLELLDIVNAGGPARA